MLSRFIGAIEVLDVMLDDVYSACISVGCHPMPAPATCDKVAYPCSNHWGRSTKSPSRDVRYFTPSSFGEYLLSVFDFDPAKGRNLGQLQGFFFNSAGNIVLRTYKFVCGESFRPFFANRLLSSLTFSDYPKQGVELVSGKSAHAT